LSIPKIPQPAKIVLSVLARDKSVLDLVQPLLERAFGPIDTERGPLAFPFTSYYDAEIGSGIKRWLWSFENLVDRGELARIKCLTNEIEQSYTIEGRRRFNLDPGFLTLANFVLATGKENAHRIYLEQGIFADLTLIFRSKTFRPLEWTYPDYADPKLIEILNGIREHYKCQLKAMSKA